MPNRKIQAILDSLSEQDRVLVVCAYQLYDGNWDALLNDLLARLEGRPYVLKLGDKIKEDIERLHRLREIERTYKIKLGDYIKI